MKKRLLSLIILAIIPLAINAQKQLSLVTLKNGTQLKGQIKSIDPTDALTIVISGIETKIKMADISKVEETTESTQTPQTQVQNTIKTGPVSQPSSEEQKLTVTDNSDYPESFDLRVGNNTIKMILVRGGDMNMGYDGRHSLSMKSEPVHRISVTSFYMSNDLTCEQIDGLGIEYKHKDKQPALITKWEQANKLADIIASNTGKTYRLPTEAEWEYAASSIKAGEIFEDAERNKKILYDWCSDYYAPFEKKYEVDPQGPEKGKDHVVRAFKAEHGMFNRCNIVHIGYGELGFVRLVIKANAIH